MTAPVEVGAEAAGAGVAKGSVWVRVGKLAPRVATLILAAAAAVSAWAVAMVKTPMAVVNGRGRCGTEKSTRRPSDDAALLAETMAMATEASGGREGRRVVPMTKKTPYRFN